MSSSRQIQAKFKHAADFGVSGTYNKANAAKFNASINQHINNPHVQKIHGAYRGNPVIHYLDPKTGLNIISSRSGEFISGWRLNSVQLQSIREHGGL
ncbi:MAG: hypothetical protein H0T62_04885 [Parachlamydiaceae bacterium]|nr:hypothetical protein [Parachlamydiaceae bacterium]